MMNAKYRVKDNPHYTDAMVAFALDQLCTSPEADVAADLLALAIQVNLRLSLSFNDYSRQDVRHGLRKVAKSVPRHTRAAGPKGYLYFILEHLS